MIFRTLLLTTSTLLASGAWADGHATFNYCENAFYPGDADADGNLSQQERADMMSAEFTALDLNADGSINRDEYANCMTQAGTRRMGQSDEGSVDAADADGDGSITLMEFTQAAMDASSAAQDGVDTTGWSGPFIAMRDGETEQDLAQASPDEISNRAAQTFAASDADGDGTVSRDEWLNRAEQYEVDVERINNNFARMDLDGSGDVSQAEYTAAGEESARAAFDAAARENAADDDSAGNPPAAYFTYYRF